MPRIARAIVPGVPHHVTQRGNRRQRTFFCIDDYMLYLAIMADACHEHGVEVWAYCLMPNHSHLIAVPSTQDSLRCAIGDAHRRYTTAVNLREGWQGYLWQGRFSSFPMDERHTIAAARYIETNPIRAGLAERAEDYVWSSARAHLSGRDDALVRVAPLLERFDDWSALLRSNSQPEVADELRKHEKTGRPLGSEAFVDQLEQALNRVLRARKPGRPGRAISTPRV